MRRRHQAPPPSPLPQRQGVDPVRVRLPEDPGGVWRTVYDHFVARYGRAIGAERVGELFARGQVVSLAGVVAADEPYEVGRVLWFHRDFAPERAVPGVIGVVHRDERLIVVDKPHFLATTPRGSHITQTAVTRLRHELGSPLLQPAHRLDRLTAGLVLFVVRPGDRGAYQTLFRDRLVRKEYEAVAAYDPGVALPRTVRSRIVKVPGVPAAWEEAGEPNSESRIELVAHAGGVGGYRLRPTTGRTHQLRVHMSGIGLPILDDPLYPVVREAVPEAEEDWSRPLQLLARALEFTDPVTGEHRRFESRLRLARWPG
ncbi:pseudouridine synthase [Streptomyces yaizuensis]|uniref:RNA pseudouridylate synthase n=1 Tax=Streptomyces yaizuensis TaxID=2989713 RepID=A0ABQ5P0U7_9ACTN|nr:pseudouridine synthase [Streptomyces sp. YSPA8]GLF96210.1 RluA family pseudouridine synthase [Streptomyces sp. YSPA8]